MDASRNPGFFVKFFTFGICLQKDDFSFLIVIPLLGSEAFALVQHGVKRAAVRMSAFISQEAPYIGIDKRRNWS